MLERMRPPLKMARRMNPIQEWSTMLEEIDEMRRNKLERDLKRARRYHQQAMQVLWRPPEVVSVGIGRRMFQREWADQICYVVHVRRKKPDSELREWERLPAELFGVPVDVQEASWNGLRRVNGFDGMIWAMDREGGGRSTDREYGSLGFFAQREGDDAKYAVTAMHVLAPDYIPTVRPHGIRVGVTLDNVEYELGVVVDGRFTQSSDIALIKLTASEDVIYRLSTQLLRAEKPYRLDCDSGLGVTLRAGNDRVVNGFFRDDDVRDTFRTDRGTEHFHGLLRFEFKTPLVEGWSGGVIYGPGRSPIALLSFGGDMDPRMGFGWPIAVHYEQQWGLRPWRQS
jgi:hypothetical protein